MTLKQLEQDVINGQRQLTTMFKNTYPELGQNIDSYFANDNFLSKEEMANIIEKKQFNERLLNIHINKNILSKTGHKILTPADRKISTAVGTFLTNLFLGLGFNRVGKKLLNSLKME